MPFRSPISPFSATRPQGQANAFACPTTLASSPDWIAASARQHMAAWQAASNTARAWLAANPHKSFEGQAFQVYRVAQNAWYGFLDFLRPSYAELARCLGDWGDSLEIFKSAQSGDGIATVTFGVSPSAPSKQPMQSVQPTVRRPNAYGGR